MAIQRIWKDVYDTPLLSTWCGSVEAEVPPNKYEGYIRSMCDKTLRPLWKLIWQHNVAFPCERDVFDSFESLIREEKLVPKFVN